MNFFYDNPIYLEYLRYHPKWYKILHYDSNMLDAFIEEAKQELHLTKRGSPVNLFVFAAFAVFATPIPATNAISF